jgi:sigma-B regulation protein RsbU (phosphoserine phosphatase)
MKVLVADDDTIARRLLETSLRQWQYDVVITCNGREAWNALQEPDAPRLAILNWMMPEVSGLEVCRRVRATPALAQMYLILVTARTEKADVVAGLDTGADEYITKPYQRLELRARIQAGRRVLDLQKTLADRVRALEASLAQLELLRGLLPMCRGCKRVRADGDYWQQLEAFLTAHGDVQFSHGICPDCLERMFGDTVAPARSK